MEIWIKMNLPNKLTMMRVILVPVFIFLVLCRTITIPYQNWIALAVYVIACGTDALDGYIARKRNLITNFGKFMDPLADKLLVCSALICFVKTQQIAAWIVIIIIGREFVISGFRLIAADKGVVIAAGIWGKAKTVVQMVMTGFLIVNLDGSFFNITEQVLIYASLILSLLSLGDYLYHNIGVLKEDEKGNDGYEQN